MVLNLCHQVIDFDLLDGSALTGGRLLGSKGTLALTAVGSALMPFNENAHVDDNNSSMLFSRTILGPCYPEGTLQCVPRPGDFTCQCRYGFDGRYCEQRRDFCAEASLRQVGVSNSTSQRPWINDYVQG